MWNIVLSEIATLGEINHHYTLLDILDANDLIQWKGKVEKEMINNERENNGNFKGANYRNRR